MIDYAVAMMANPMKPEEDQIQQLSLFTKFSDISISSNSRYYQTTHITLKSWSISIESQPLLYHIRLLKCPNQELLTCEQSLNLPTQTNQSY